MKKTLIALAVAGFVAAPAAMADVTVYGQAHVSLDNINSDNDAADAALIVNNRASRLGVKAAEDLGGGLTAVAQMEFGIDVTGDTDSTVVANDAAIKSRNQFVGLAGGFGTVAVGRLDTPYKSSTGSLDVFADTAADYNALIGTPAGLELRAADAIAYLSPDMGGFSVQAAIVAATADADTPADGDDDVADATSIAVQYKNGPLFVAAAMESFAAEDTAAGTRLGVGYDLGAAKIGGVYETVKNAGNVKDQDYNAVIVNVAVPMGGNTLIAEVGQNDKKDVSKTTLASVGLAHGFSKNTSGYVAVAAISTDPEVGDKVNTNQLTAGMVVKF